ncbi:Chlorophyll a-b binding protein [Psidium guajava]|nr:Chlorophyll a-b binding protein [Psidium guajava]
MRAKCARDVTLPCVRRPVNILAADELEGGGDEQKIQFPGDQNSRTLKPIPKGRLLPNFQRFEPALRQRSKGLILFGKETDKLVIDRRASSTVSPSMRRLD